MTCSTEYTKRLNRRCTRLSTVQNNISLIILSSVNSYLLHDHDTLAANFGRTCSITRHTNAQQFIRCIKRSPPYQNVLVLLDDISVSSTQNILKRLEIYRSIKSILIVSSQSTLNEKKDLNTATSLDFNLNSMTEILTSYERLNIRLKQLIQELAETFVDDDMVVTLNRKEKSFTNLRNELGSFLWIDSLRGRF